ncbi:alpha carbonic anhydrase 1, chloroplastic-like [Henckelia pumila]|uniref:alpha carbonic anhydrase 1, chloroplastic-like n=1 Tax=Henckelia pumila TaxID=405737 RepID=UPI003C6DF4B5
MSAPTMPLFLLLTCTVVLFVYSGADNNGTIPFTYTGSTGPNSWGHLSPNFSLCGTGKSQSPINILTDKAVVNKNLKPLTRFYGFANVTLVNNKFNVGIRYPDHSGGITVDNKMYTLKQMHWHSPAEHRINGQRHAAELHLVHVAEDGSVTVVAILFKFGQPDPLVDKIQSKLNELEYEVKIHEDIPITFGPFHPTELRKKTHKYYRYVGSFSTPPCTENVIWHILGKVRTISRKQVEALRAPLDTSCKNNARPCQLINGRHVELYEEETIS